MRNSDKSRKRANKPRGSHARIDEALDSTYSADMRSARGGRRASHRARGRRQNRRTITIVVLIVLACLLVVGAIGAVVGYRDAKQLKTSAETATTNISKVVDQIKQQDYTGAAQTAQSVSSNAASMAECLNSPLWKAAAKVPVLGSDVQGAATLVDVLQEAADNMLIPLTRALVANPPSSLVGADKQINVAGVTTLLNTCASVSGSSSKIAAMLDSMPKFHIKQLQSAADKATDKFETIDTLLQIAKELAPFTGNMLGADGSRNYLVVAQNSAEIRASGGFPGSCGSLTVSNGKITLNDFERVVDVLGNSLPSSIQVTEEEDNLFNRYYSALTYPYDWCIDADFPRTGSVWAASYEENASTAVDGTIGVTPTMVQKMLAIAGPITLSDGRTLDGTNATKQLQHDIYWDYISEAKYSAANNSMTDDLFSEAASEAFSKIFDNLTQSNLLKLVECMLDGIETREVMVWMADADEQSAMTTLGFSGTVLNDESNPVLGIYLNDWTVSKMGWYLDCDTIISQNKGAEGSKREYTVTVTLRNTITSAEASSGGQYIVGKYSGQMEQLPYFYAPAGGSIEMIDSDGVTVDKGTYQGLQVLSAQTRIPVGGIVTFTMKVTTAAGSSDLKISKTPTLTSYR